MHFSALTALSKAENGQLQQSDLYKAIEANTELDDWALEPYESGVIRWRSIFGFASVGLIKGGYLKKSKGIWSITDEGRSVLSKPFDGVTFLAEINRRYQAWKSAQIVNEGSSISSSGEMAVGSEEELPEAPEELISRTVKAAHEALAAELIERAQSCDPAFFEHLVVQLLLKMGYGGSRQEAGQAVGRVGDGGIDGIINEDRLGLDAIYLQAKRWNGPVGEGPIRDFVGALDIKGVKKGVFITTSSFTPSAKLAISSIRSDKKIVLIDGVRLAELMIEHDLGVSVAATYQLKRVDTDFFSEE